MKKLIRITATMEPADSFEYEVFIFLEALRQSGVTNMYGAGPYVEYEFDVDRKYANELVGKWMKQYDREWYKTKQRELNEYNGYFEDFIG